MRTILYEIRAIECGSPRRTIAICSSKAKVLEKLKILVEEPSCSQPIKSECFIEGDNFAHAENVHGWWADYFVEEIVLDEWID